MRVFPKHVDIGSNPIKGSMKRKEKIKNKYRHSVYKVRSWFFWNKCAKCKDEFRRERGWRFLTGPFVGGMGKWRYLCASCCNNEQHAHDLANSFPFERPLAPPKI